MQKDTFPNACEYARASVWGLKISKARTLALVPSRAPLAPPRPVRPLALGSPALPPCSFTTVGSCSLTGDAPGTLTRVEGARRVAASGTRVRRQSFRRARATVARESIACVHTTASRRARGNRAMHPCTHAPMHPCTHACVRACVQTTTQTIHADNRRAFRARVGRPVILSGSRARLEHHPRTTASPRPRPTRARTHTHKYHAHTAPPRHRIARRTHKTPDASHRIASHRIASRSTPRTRSRLSRHRHARTDDARRRRIRRKHIRVIHTSRRVWRRRSLRARGRRERAIVVFFARADGAPSRIGRRRRIRIRDARRRARRTTPRLRRIKKKHSVSRDARTRTHTRVHTRAHTHTRGSRPRDVFRIRGTAHVRAHGCIRARRRARTPARTHVYETYL